MPYNKTKSDAKLPQHGGEMNTSYDGNKSNMNLPQHGGEQVGGGFGKKTDLKQFKIQRRGGSGIKAAQVTPKTGPIVAAKILESGLEDVIAISQHGQVIRTSLGSISLLGRATQGVRIMKLDAGDKVASVTCL